VDWPAAIAALSLAGWLGVALGTARAWDLRPIGEDESTPPEPTGWPSVAALFPARNEAAVLPLTLPALRAQDYPGAWHLVVVDDRSTDGTRDLATVPGTDLPGGWIGKVWALEQGRRAAGGLALNSRMARLRCQEPAERLLIPPFVYFFNLLYPMRRVNGRPAAAGGCMLVRRDALERAGGFAAIRDRVIDDVSLARAIRPHGKLRLAVSRSDVVSLREHDFRGIWRMVSRTAFTELRHSWSRLALTVALLLLLFAAPPILAVVGFTMGSTPTGAAAAAAWALLTALYLPTIRYFRLNPVWALTLPLAGLLYGAMTVDSARRARHGSW